jgi:alkanesulfonate monooxygenase SsuD/methylene tetrahydromethanopterin reductase-like flavin-dependent oxidoreductase (luciferase family)
MGFHVALPNDGLDGMWVAEHVLPPTRHPDPSYASEYDPFVLLSYLAAHTSRVRIGTSVLVLPLRNPFNVAKQAASLPIAATMRRLCGTPYSSSLSR